MINTPLKTMNQRMLTIQKSALIQFNASYFLLEIHLYNHFIPICYLNTNTTQNCFKEYYKVLTL